MSGVSVGRTWSYCGGSDPVETFPRSASTRAEMPTNDREVGTAIETTTELKTPLRWAVMALAQIASALLPEAQAETEKGV
jgi:hypothetical protein